MSNYILPPWLHGPPDPAGTMLAGYHAAAGIALQNAGLAQRNRIAQQEAQFRADEFAQNRDMQEQRIAMERAYKDQELGLKAQDAAQKYQAIREYQDSITNGMDPLDALLLHGPAMGSQSSAEAAAIRAQAMDANQNTADWQVTQAQIPNMGDWTDREIATGEAEDPQMVNYMQRGKDIRFIPKTAISGGPEDGVAGPITTDIEGLPGFKSVAFPGTKVRQVIKPEAEKGLPTVTALEHILENKKVGGYSPEQINAASNMLSQAVSGRSRKNSPSPIDQAFLSSQPQPMPKSQKEAKVGQTYITSKGPAIWDGQHFVLQSQPVQEQAPAEPAAPTE